MICSKAAWAASEEGDARWISAGGGVGSDESPVAPPILQTQRDWSSTHECMLSDIQHVFFESMHEEQITPTSLFSWRWCSSVVLSKTPCRGEVCGGRVCDFPMGVVACRSLHHVVSQGSLAKNGPPTLASYTAPSVSPAFWYVTPQARPPSQASRKAPPRKRNPRAGLWRGFGSGSQPPPARPAKNSCKACVPQAQALSAKGKP